MFFSLMKLYGLKASATWLRRRLLTSAKLHECGEPSEARRILKSDTEYGTVDCAFIFAHEFLVNICIHYDLPNGARIFCHILVATARKTLHLNLTGRHFIPYEVVGTTPAPTPPLNWDRSLPPSSDDDQTEPKSPVFGRKQKAKQRAPKSTEKFTHSTGSTRGSKQQPLEGVNQSREQVQADFADDPVMPACTPLNSDSGPSGSASRENEDAGSAPPQFNDATRRSNAGESGLDGCVSSDTSVLKKDRRAKSHPGRFPTARSHHYFCTCKHLTSTLSVLTKTSYI